MADMDVPVDCSEAFVVTTAERARDLKAKPVYVHAMALGGTRIGEYYENWAGWDYNSFTVCMDGVKARSDLWIDDFDVFYPYDGYTIDAIAIVEAAGYCKPGESAGLFRDGWDAAGNVMRLGRGRTAVTPNGGGLSMGRSGGSNLYSDAVMQLRGEAGARQVEGAKHAMIGIGSFFHDPSAMVFTSEA